MVLNLDPPVTTDGHTWLRVVVGDEPGGALAEIRMSQEKAAQPVLLRLGQDAVLQDPVLLAPPGVLLHLLV